MLIHTGKVNLKLKLIESHVDSFTSVKDTIYVPHITKCPAYLVRTKSTYLLWFFLKFQLVLKQI